MQVSPGVHGSSVDGGSVFGEPSTAYESGVCAVNTGSCGTSTGIQVEDASQVVVEGNHTSFTASSGILVWVYASLVDNATGDPTTTMAVVPRG